MLFAKRFQNHFHVEYGFMGRENMKEIIYIYIINLRQPYPRSWTLILSWPQCWQFYTQYSIQHHASYVLIPSVTVQSKSQTELDFIDQWIIWWWIWRTKQNRKTKTQMAPRGNTGEPLDLIHRASKGVIWCFLWWWPEQTVSSDLRRHAAHLTSMLWPIAQQPGLVFCVDKKPAARISDIYMLQVNTKVSFTKRNILTGTAPGPRWFVFSCYIQPFLCQKFSERKGPCHKTPTERVA